MSTMGVFPRQAQGSQEDNSNVGENTETGSSLSAFFSTLIPVLIIATAIFIVFLLFRKKYPRVYQPRTYIGSLRNWQKSPTQTAGLLGWRKEYSELRDEFVMGHASIDNYLWLRFFRMLCVMCLVGCFITWPILFPVNATGNAPNINGFDVLSFSHILPGPRYYAQVLVAWVFMAWVMFMITRELKFFTYLRHQYYISPLMRRRISPRTVLFTNVAEEARNEEFLRREYPAAKYVWLVNVPEELAEKVKDRDTAATKLENGEIKLIQNYIKRLIKKEKKEGPQTAPTEGRIQVDEKDLPMHRLPKFKFLPIGKKVKTLEWSREELHRLIPEVAKDQASLRNSNANLQAACFIEFGSPQEADAAMRGPASLKDKAKSKAKPSLTPKELGPHPDNVIWNNIIKSSSKVRLFNLICTAFVWFLCIFWTIPVAVVGAISNINYLTETVPFLSFINSIPPAILGVVTGLLPVVLLAVLMALVPIICNIMAKLFEPTHGAVQMKVQGWYFPFQVIQVFLVTTFASGAASVVSSIVNNPAQAPALLAQNLPKASNFYLAYFVLFGLNTAAMQFLNVVPLLFVLFLGKILDKTPRKMYNRYANLAGLGWGSLYPKFTNLGVIALAYSCISPLILGFATIGFYLLYLAFRYNALFTLGTTVSTRGASYARAMQQLTTGIYLAEICLIGLFAIGAGTTTQAVGPLVLGIILLIATIGWQIWMNRTLKKLDQELNDNVPFADSRAVDVEKFSEGPAAGTVKPTISEDSTARAGDKTLFSGQHSNPGLMARIKGYFAPSDAANNVIRSLLPNLNQTSRDYTQKEHDEAYIHPAIISECPQVWIARDKYGLSKQEMQTTREKVGEGLEMTDEGAIFNEKGKVEWNQDTLEQAPIWEEEVAY